MDAQIDLSASASPPALAALDRMLKALQAALRLPPQWDAGLEKKLDEAFAAYDQYIAIVVDQHPMSCRSGCTACCHDNPRGVSGLELKRLAQWIDQQPERSALHARFEALAAAKTDAATWRRQQIPCPLLADGKCRAYALRPVACRAFHALTPAAWCHPQDPNYAQRQNPHLDPPQVLLLALKVLSERLGLPAPQDLHQGLARL